ncbi:MAG: dihydroorotate dehydrogenase-like protein [Bacteroidales bacterium]
MDLSTTYMGLKLKNPIIVSSSKLTNNIGNIKKCADQGAGAIVLKSLFEEQLLADADKLMDQDDKYFWFPEAVDFINKYSKEYGVKEYLELIREAKKMTGIPILGSINCSTPNEWPKFAKNLEEAGLDGLELNISIFPFDANVTSKTIEDRYVEIIEAVKAHVSIPVSVKIGACFTNLMQMVSRLSEAGADAVVLFNRYYRPDIDIDTGKIHRDNYFSAPEEITQSLRWVSLLSNKVKCDIAANTGIHNAEGVIKQLYAGASATQICTTLYKNGIGVISSILFDIKNWMEKNAVESIGEFQGSVASREENLAAFERVQFMKKTLTEE